MWKPTALLPAAAVDSSTVALSQVLQAARALETPCIIKVLSAQEGPSRSKVQAGSQSITRAARGYAQTVDQDLTFHYCFRTHRGHKAGRWALWFLS
jgi:hypothetical protein